MALINNSNLPSIQRIKFEDYKEAPKWFAEFLNPLNLFMTAVYNIINRGISYSNLGCLAPVSVQFTPGTTIGLTLSNPLIVAPQVVIIGNVYEKGDLTVHPAVTIQIMWHFSQGKIFVDDVIGLTPGTTYIITVLVG